MFNQVQLLNGLQKKSEELKISKGDLVMLGSAIIVQCDTEKLKLLIGRIQCIPMDGPKREGIQI